MQGLDKPFILMQIWSKLDVKVIKVWRYDSNLSRFEDMIASYQGLKIQCMIVSFRVWRYDSKLSRFEDMIVGYQGLKIW